MRCRVLARAGVTERLEARVPRTLKQTLQKAAAVTGHSTLTSYVVFALQTSAQAAIDEHERARLSAGGVNYNYSDAA